MRALAVFAIAVTTACLQGDATAARANVSRPAAGILFERDGDLHAVALDGSRTVRVTSTPVWDERGPAVSPDGRSIAYARGDAIWVTTLDGRATRRVTSGSDSAPAWSPNGRRLYFTRWFRNRHGEYCGSIFRKSSDATERAQRVTKPTSFHSHESPSVSSDGRRIAFTDANLCAGGTTSYVIRVVDTSGRPTGDLARLPGNEYLEREYQSPSWDPSGTRIAIRGSGILIASRDGTGVRRITPEGIVPDFDGARWSPDGQWLTFSADGDVFVVRSDGKGLRRLMRTEARESVPTWLPRLPG